MNTKCFQVSLKDSDAKIDPEEGVIQSVSLISLGEARGHDVFVDKTTLQQVFDKAVEMGSVKVKADHGSGVFATIGYVDNFSLNGKQVLGDFHVYEAEPEKPRIFEIAEKNPNHLGMSIEFTGDDERVDGQMRARCDELITSALVSDPAANKSLFSKKTVDSKKSLHSVPSMATTTKQPVKKFKTKLEDPEKDKKPTDMETMLARMEELETRLSKYEQDEENEDEEGEEGKAPLKATDPSVEPKVENDEKEELDDDSDSTALEDGDEEEPDGDEEDEDEVSKKKEKLSKAKMSKKGFSAKASRRDIIALAAKFGMKLSPAGAGDSQSKGKKTFEALVSEKTIELKGDKNAATVFCLNNHKAEYAEYRKNFVAISKSRTL